MKKTHRKKLALERTTIRSLLASEVSLAQGGQRGSGGVSVGTCTACTETYNPTCPISCPWTEQVGCP
jgi:hypothetical protein